MHSILQYTAIKCEVSKKRKKKVSLMGVGRERGTGNEGRACGSFLDLGIIVGKKDDGMMMR